MAQRNERSSLTSSSSRERLHYFTLPNDGLNWGSQRFLRCMTINPNSTNSDHYQSSVSPATDRRKVVTHKRHFTVSPTSNSGYRINKSVPENLMSDLQTAANRMKISMVEEKGKEKVLEDNNNYNKSGPLKPWNLRTRRASCKVPQANGSSTVASVQAVVATAGGGGGEKGVNCDVLLRGGMGNGVEQKVERPKFSFSLSKEEIENDFIAMTGAKQRRRPKKRLKVVQRKLDDLVPGLWLREVTTETYKVDDDPEPRKGLK